MTEHQFNSISNIDMGEFVSFYQSASSMSAVARHFNLPYSTTKQKVDSLRKAGVNLKVMPKKVRPPLDVEGLNRLISAMTTPEKETMDE